VNRLPDAAGVYAIISLTDDDYYLYVGETQSLQRRLERLCFADGQEPWFEYGKHDLQLQILETPLNARLANQLTLLAHTNGSAWNSHDIAMVA
jgi:hypothetical protein